MEHFEIDEDHYLAVANHLKGKSTGSFHVRSPEKMKFEMAPPHILIKLYTLPLCDYNNDNEITLFRHIFIIYKLYFTSAYVLITLVIKTYMCPGDLISAKLCRYHKATKIISKYVLQ